MATVASNIRSDNQQGTKTTKSKIIAQVCSDPNAFTIDVNKAAVADLTAVQDAACTVDYINIASKLKRYFR